MTEVVGLCFVLAIVLSAVAVVGHGLWVLVARALAIILRNEPPTAARPSDVCPQCYAPLPAPGKPCGVCHWRGVRSQPSASGAMAALSWHVKRIARLGIVEAETEERLLTAIAAERARVLAEIAARPSVERRREHVVPAFEQADTQPKPATAPTRIRPFEDSGRATRVAAEVSPTKGVGARAEQYAARRAAAAAERAEPTKPPPAQKRETLSKLLAAFMEEKNIRWGELVGGMLIVCCSIALVISFWSEIAASSFFKFFLFGGVTAAMFAIGLYTERRWKLRTTSHGILIIATLLVPLNFLAIAAFTQDSPPTDAIAIGGEVVSIGLFAALIWTAGRVYLPNAPLLLATGAMVPSVMQLLTRRFVGVDAPLWLLYATAAVPMASYLGAMTLYLAKLFRAAVPARQDAERMFIFCGVATYATLLPLALLLYKTQAVGETLQSLSPLVTLLGLPALATGLWFWRRVRSDELVGERTAGISIGVLGAATMVAAVVFAWPAPAMLLPVALLTTASFTAIAVVFAIPAAHAVAGAAFALAWLVTFLLARGDIAWNPANAAPLSSSLVSAASGVALSPLAGVFVVGAVAWFRAGRKSDATWYCGLAGATSAASLALVTWFGFAVDGDPHGAAWVYAAYSVVALVAAIRFDRRWLGWTASGLTLLAIVQAVVYRWPLPLVPLHVWAVALLAHASLAALIAGALRVVRNDEGRQLRSVLCHSGLATSCGAAAFLAVAAGEVGANQTTPHVYWLSGVWLALAWIANWPRVFAAFQAALFVSVFTSVTAVLAERPWYAAAERPWLDPWFLQAQGIAMAALCLAWIGVRFAVARIGRLDGESSPIAWTTKAQRLLNPPWPSVDRIGHVVVVLLLLFLAIYAAIPGVCQELSPSVGVVEAGGSARVAPPIGQFELRYVPQEHAAEFGTWILLAAAVGLLAAGLWDGNVVVRCVGVLLAFAAAYPLIAARFEESVAVASALRWSVAAFFLVASVPLWFNSKFQRLSERWKLPVQSHGDWIASPAVAYRTVLFGVAAFPYLAMALFVGIAAVGRAGVPISVSPLLPWLAGVFVTVAAGVLMIRKSAAGRTTRWAEPASITLHVLAAAPLLVAVLFTVAAALRQYPIVGPEPGTFFRNVGWSVSYAMPVLAMAATLVVHAVREQSSRIAFAAGLLFNVGATAGSMLLLPQLGRGLDGRAWVNVAQVNTIVAAVFAVAWIAVLAWHRRRIREDQEATLPPLLQAQVSLCVGLCVLSILPAIVWLVVAPTPAAWVVEAGNWLGWLGAILAVAAVAATSRTAGTALLAAAPGIGAVAALLVPLTVTRWDTGNWLAYHTLLVASAALGCGLAMIGRIIGSVGQSRSSAYFASTIVLGLTVLLALRALAGDPQAPWWTICALVASSVLSVALALGTMRYGYLYIAATVLNVAASVWWFESGFRMTSSTEGGIFVDAAHINIMVATLPVVLWVIIEHSWMGALSAMGGVRRRIGLPQISATASVALLMLTGISGTCSDVAGGPRNSSLALAWLAVVSTSIASIACLWITCNNLATARIYFLALAAAALVLDSLNLEGPIFWWMLTMVLAAFSLATSYAWSRRSGLRDLAARVGVPIDTQKPLEAATGLAWLVPANSLIAAAVTTLAFWMVLTFDGFTERMFAAYAILAQAVAVGLLARGAVRSSLQYASLVLGVPFAIAFGWAWLPVGLDAPLLHRTVVVAAALVATSVLYGLGLVKLLRRENEWTKAAARLVPSLAAAVTATILLVLGVEVAEFFNAGRVPMFWAEILAVAIALGGMCVAALAAALLPGRDPLRLSDRGKQAYVYAAEVALALLGLHIRLTMPWLFQGWFVRYWPLVVMAIAFGGVGVGEWLARRRAKVLSEPLQTTGALLPVLPVLGFWVAEVDVNYSLLLLSAGVLYTALAALRSSFLYGVLAAISANGSLWYLLHGANGLGLAEHPQLWLIPPALCVLIAAYLNRDQLSKEQITTVRYMSAIVIYVSSTADIFINGVANAPWLPLVLAGVSILGIFAGIVMRVRAFVYLGASFLAVALFTIIWHAAVELGYAWLWWVCGIAAGMGIIALFAVFEKKRDDMLRLVERVRGWEP